MLQTNEKQSPLPQQNVKCQTEPTIYNNTKTNNIQKDYPGKERTYTNKTSESLFN